MKTLLSLALVLLNATIIFGQDCNGYFAQKKGTKIEIQSYDKKDKPSAILKYEVLDNSPIAGGVMMTLKNEMIDNKGRQVSSVTLETKCVNGDFTADITSMGGDFMPKGADIQVSVTGDKLMYPSSLKAGQKLKDVSTSVKTSMGGMTLMTTNINITDRQVEGIEMVETPAGKFECAKITYTSSFKFMGNRVMKATEYLAKGVGLVKSESYDDSGKKQSSSILTKYEK